jgi:dynein heavy chain
VDYGTLQKAIERQITLNGMQPVPSYVAKVIQLFETMLVRHGVMVVGLTLTGKTMNTNMLAAALSQLKRDGDESPKYEVTKQHWLNPKSITMGELYGEVNTVTQEWSDGIVPYLVRLCVTDESENKNWVVFDGPVDALWIENMNTVLDDNKKLCLVSGEIVALSNEMTMMFEVEDLAVASPATVSRCGMVYTEPTSLGYDVLVQSWIEALEKGSFSGSLGAWWLSEFSPAGLRDGVPLNHIWFVLYITVYSVAALALASASPLGPPAL